MNAKIKRPYYALVLALVIVLTGIAGGSSAQDVGRTARQGMLRASVKLMTPYEFSKDAGSLCSGTLINQLGYILTNFHCVGYPVDGERDRELERAGLRPGDLYNRQGTSVVAMTTDARRLPAPTYNARVIATDPEADLAVLKITSYVNSRQPLPKPLPLVTLPLADSDEIEALDRVYVIGYPGVGGDTVTATEGMVSGFIDEDKDGAVDWIKTDVLINQGSSGGAAVNERGELMGIPTARVRDQSGSVIYLIRPSNHAVALIQRAIRAGESASATGDATIGSSPTLPDGQNIGALAFGAGFKAGELIGAADAFPQGVTEVHAAVPYQGMRDGTRWSYVWLLEGKTVTGQEDLKWQYGASGVLDIYLKGKNGLSDGRYTLQVRLNDAVAQEGRFSVGDPNAKNLPQKPSGEALSEGVTISGKIIDHSTRRPIQGAAIAFLYPGQTVRSYDADKSKGKVNTVQAYGVTDAGGVFTSDRPLVRGETYTVIVSARGYQRVAENDVLEITDDDPDVVELDDIELDRQ
jgi:S1-C subfamily serine protease